MAPLLSWWWHELLTRDGAATDVGKLAVLAGVCDHPLRVKCATLAWHVLNAALAGQADTVSTEDEGPPPPAECIPDGTEGDRP